MDLLFPANARPGAHAAAESNRSELEVSTVSLKVLLKQQLQSLAVVSAAAAAGPATAAIKRLPDNPLENLFAMMHRRVRMALRRLLDLAHYRSRA